MRQKIFFTFLGGLLTLFLSACSKDSGADAFTDWCYFAADKI